MPARPRNHRSDLARAVRPPAAQAVDRQPTPYRRLWPTGAACALASALTICLLLAIEVSENANAGTLPGMSGVGAAKKETLVAAQGDKARNAANYRVVLGTLLKPDRTFYQYGEYLIRDKRTGRFYAIDDGNKMLDRYVGEQVLVFGLERVRYSDGAVEGGPPLIEARFAVPLSLCRYKTPL